uniref:Holliday junction branch migration protein RuvA n=1 Tax=Agathobacter sp. TaxID=2021311 RepID=UPI004056DDB8
MYSFIRGELAEIETDHIVVDVNGIGYNLYIPANCFAYLPQIGQECKIHTYLHIREDAMMLYGFLTKDDLSMFKQLITVSGIGPKGAIGILSALSADDLRFAILAQDAKAISKAPGIGAKTAQRVILELKDKVNFEDTFEKKPEKEQVLKASVDSQVKNDAVLALNALGYSSSESLKAVSKVTITEAMSVEDVLKLALKFML